MTKKCMIILNPSSGKERAIVDGDLMSHTPAHISILPNHLTFFVQ